jgi:tRNA U34 5-carboxymethylaminomethyl modifying GTPase MnmE/TrmE
MKKILNNPRTASQNKRLYFLLNHLNIGADIKADLALQYSNNRTGKTSELQYIECQSLINNLEKLMQKQGTPKSERASTMLGDRDDLDKKRKGVIKAIFRWYELQNKEVSMEYVKATACRAAGVESFNKISPEALTRIYAEFCRKQRTQEVMNENYFVINKN